MAGLFITILSGPMAYNHCIPNIVDLSCALITLRIQYMYEHTQTQF